MKQLILHITILLSLTASISFACDPDTVEFYLEKGFSQEQITKICSQSPSTDNKGYQPYQKPVVIVQEGYSPGTTAEERKAVNELKGSLDARSVDVTDSHVNYIKRVCIKAGQSPELDQRVNQCIDIAFSIARDGLIVKESGAGLLVFGQQQIEVVSSDIIRKHVTKDPWAKFPPDLRFLLQRKYESQEKGNSTELPLRKSASTGQVVSAIRTIASSTISKREGKPQSEVARVLDDSYVPPSEEEYIASNPTFDEIEEEKKKKKKWWNPFD